MLAQHLSQSTAWFTPAVHIEAARAVLGHIELDPASCALANETVQATRYNTEEEDGLQRDWISRALWMNPPYGKVNGKSNQEIWSAKLLSEYRAGHVQAAIMLLNAATDCQWFKPLWVFPLCFTDHRIHFCSPHGESAQPTHGNVFVYLGPHSNLFAQVFGRFGIIVLPERCLQTTRPMQAAVPSLSGMFLHVRREPSSKAR
jgi:ParB family transcriptional regulator, chromosome partitioning protein